MINKYVFGILGSVLITVFMISGCVETETPTEPETPPFNFTFYINETGEPIDGEVYLDDIFLGRTKNGFLQTNLSLFSGELKINGSYNNTPFEFYFDFLYDEYKDYYLINPSVSFMVFERDLKELAFNASQLDLRKIERQIFDMTNLEREKYPKAKIRRLRWNDKIAVVAREHSQDMLLKEYFAHKTLVNPRTLETIDFEERLKMKGIFYIVTNENAMLLPVNSSTNIAEETINGWLGSPGHRSTILDLDNLYSDAGVGIACSKNFCYVTMDFVKLYSESETTLKKDYVAFYLLYDEGWGFTKKIKVNVKINSSEPLDIFIVPDNEQYKRFIKRRSYDKIEEKYNTRIFEKEIIAEPGYGIILHNKGREDAKIDIKFDYSNN